METRTRSTSLVLLLFALSVVSVAACGGNNSGSPLQPTPLNPLPADDPPSAAASPVGAVADPQVPEKPAPGGSSETEQLSGAAVTAALASLASAGASSTRIYSNADYTVVTATCNVRDAGTDANILIGFVGELGSSGWINLDNPNVNDLERDHNDRFSGVDRPIIWAMRGLPNVGTPSGFWIYNDGSGSSPGWALCGLVVVVKTPDGILTSRTFRSSPNWIDGHEEKMFNF